MVNLVDRKIEETVEAMGRRILVTGLESPDDQMLSDALENRGYEVSLQPWSPEVPALVEDQTYDAIVVQVPLPGVGLGVLLSSIRARTARCRNAGLLIISSDEDVMAVQKLVGRGVNRVLPKSASVDEVLDALEEIEQAPQRVTVRLPVQLEVTLPEYESRAFCQTENLSESGMLIRGFQRYVPGTRFSFRLQIPGEDRCLTGTAEVTRNTDVDREKIEGFGARFVEIGPGDQAELERILIEAISEIC